MLTDNYNIYDETSNYSFFYQNSTEVLLSLFLMCYSSEFPE